MSNNAQNINTPIQAIPTPIMQMRITVLNNGTISVGGIPSKLETALEILANANKAIVRHFINKAKEGELDDNNTTIKNRILTQDKRILS